MTARGASHEALSIRPAGGKHNIAMSTLDFLDRNLLWIAPPLMCVSAVLLGLFIRNEVRLVKGSKILSAPLVEQQNIDFPEAGRVSLCIEGPRFSRRFAGLSYTLSTHDGTLVEGRPVLVRTSTTGVKWARLSLVEYEIPRPGGYVLRVQGLGTPQERDADHHLVFTRPHLGQTFGYIIGMIFAFGLFVVSLVFFLIRLIGKDQAT